MKRIGDRAYFEGTVNLTGAPTATTLTLNLPSGYVIDTSKLTNSNTRATYGTVKIRDASPGIEYSGQVAGNTSTSVDLTYEAASSIAAISDTAPITFANSDSVYFKFDVPIVGWGASQIMSSDAATNVVAARATGVSATVTGSMSDITWSTIASDTNGAMGAVNYTIPVPGYYSFDGSVFISGTAALNNTTELELYNTTTSTSLATARYTYGGAITSGVSVPFLFKNINVPAGTQLKIRILSNITSPVVTGGGNAYNYLQVSRASGPSQIMSSDSVSALYTGSPPTGTLGTGTAITVFGTKVKDTHNAYVAGSYTVPVSGTYSISASTGHQTNYNANNLVQCRIFIDGVLKYSDIVNTFSGQTYANPKIHVDSVPLLAGQVVTVRAYDSFATTFLSDSSINFFSITKIGNY
jgi:hypothetical protein